MNETDPKTECAYCSAADGPLPSTTPILCESESAAVVRVLRNAPARLPPRTPPKEPGAFGSSHGKSDSGRGGLGAREGHLALRRGRRQSAMISASSVSSESRLSTSGASRLEYGRISANGSSASDAGKSVMLLPSSNDGVLCRCCGLSGTLRTARQPTFQRP